MIESILNSIKKPLGIDEDYDAFDDDIMMHINSAFSTLFSVGASGPTPFMILSEGETWSDFLGDIKQAMMVKSYVYLKVKLIFDPPTSSFALDAMKKQADEYEWRLAIMEFVFNPASRPVDTAVNDRRVIGEIDQQLDNLENQVEELDEEINVPDLSTIFQRNYSED